MSIFLCDKSTKSILWDWQNKKHTPKKTKQYLISQGFLVLLVASFALHLYSIIYSDTKNQQYIVTTAQYTRDARNVPKDVKKNLSYYEKVEIVEGDKKYSLRLPHRWRDYEFPEGTHWGTIWYSEKTKVILQFDPIEQENPIHLSQDSNN